MCSEENKFELVGNNGATHAWKEDEAAYSQKNTIPIMKHGGDSIMVWGFFAYTWTEELRIVDSTKKSAQYILSCQETAYNHDFRI